MSNSDSKSPAVRDLDRVNLRLAPETFAEIDRLRARRPGTVSRNTWIAEAIQEKLAREQGEVLSVVQGGRRHA